jgi:hypothetical protein
MTDIRMPKTPRSAYDPKRRANTLLINQVRELEKAVKQAGRGVKSKKPRTEAQVASYMRHLNRALHQQVLLPKNMKRRPLDVPAVEPPRKKKTSRPKSKRSRRS